jgi:hypothetical protein
MNLQLPFDVQKIIIQHVVTPSKNTKKKNQWFDSIQSMRHSCQSWQNLIDDEVNIFMKDVVFEQDKELQIIKGTKLLGFTSYVAKTLSYLKVFEWNTFKLLFSRECSICHEKFSGGISEFGILAHSTCLKQRCISLLFAVKNPTLFPLLEITSEKEQEEILKTIPVRSCTGYDKYSKCMTEYEEYYALCDNNTMLPNELTLEGVLRKYLGDTIDERIENKKQEEERKSRENAIYKREQKQKLQDAYNTRLEIFNEKLKIKIRSTNCLCTFANKNLGIKTPFGDYFDKNTYKSDVNVDTVVNIATSLQEFKNYCKTKKVSYDLSDIPDLKKHLTSGIFSVKTFQDLYNKKLEEKSRSNKNKLMTLEDKLYYKKNKYGEIIHLLPYNISKTDDEKCITCYKCSGSKYCPHNQCGKCCIGCVRHNKQQTYKQRKRSKHRKY